MEQKQIVALEALKEVREWYENAPAVEIREVEEAGEQFPLASIIVALAFLQE